MAADPTFRAYSSEDAKRYATQRPGYSSNLINKVLNHHTATGGQFNQLLDVGCGPGNATRDLSPSFERAIGADPGEEMIQAAKALGGKTKNGAVDYVVSAAEEISGIQGLEEGSVDLLVSAMAVSY